MEWEVWLVDGRRITSLEMPWVDLPDGILVVRRWDAPTNGVNWDDGLYGQPDTLKEAGWTDDETFAAVLAEAKAAITRPSER